MVCLLSQPATAAEDFSDMSYHDVGMLHIIL